LPDGRTWGSTSGVAVGSDGNIWAIDRCGANSCANSDLDPIFEFEPSGRLLRHFGKGLFVQPHGLSIDKEGNIWVTDGLAQDGKGLQVFKFSPEGKILLTLGKKGVAGPGTDTFGAPSAAIVAADGSIFVADGHHNCNCDSRVVKFSKDGKFLAEFGKKGEGKGELNLPHALAIDSEGRLLVGDRSNNRIAIFDQSGRFLTEWKQFGRPSGICIYKGTIYVSDSESTEADGYGNNPGVQRGIRIGNLKDGKVDFFIPDPAPMGNTSSAEGVAVDHQGNVYGAEVGPKDLKKYVR
jgi:streptogramin lyase